MDRWIKEPANKADDPSEFNLWNPHGERKIDSSRLSFNLHTHCRGI